LKQPIKNAIEAQLLGAPPLLIAENI